MLYAIAMGQIIRPPDINREGLKFYPLHRALQLSKVLRPTRYILGHFGDSGVTAAPARIIAAASAEASSPAQPRNVCGVE